MAYRHRGESPKQASTGDILQVIHEFLARSPDELSLRKGDRIELIERDDDFGDGWYLGKHMADGRTGLFPEVYTKLAPQGSSTQTGPRTRRTSSTPNAQPLATPLHSKTYSSGEIEKVESANSSAASGKTSVPPTPFSESHEEQDQSHHYQPTPPLNTSMASQRTVSVPNGTYPSPTISSAPTAQRSISLMMENGRNHEEDSPVINETLSVIDEHITDMNTPRSSLLASESRGFNDSESEYSNHLNHRMSYINGNETDEEERNAYSQAEVSQWSPERVAEHLEDIGVDKRHCEIFQEQEISGEVILNLDQASIFMKEFDLGLVGRRLRTWHKIKAFQEEVLSNGPTSARQQKSHNQGRSVDSLPRIPNIASSNNRHLRQGSPLAGSYSPGSAKNSATGGFPIPQPDSPGRYLTANQADYDHSRRHSSVDYNRKASTSSIGDTASTAGSHSQHYKKPSLDRNWTMNSSGSPVANRASTVGVSTHSRSPSTQDIGSLVDGSNDFDRGYLSGGEIEGGRLRNVLRKRGTTSASHSRQSSYRDSNVVGTSRRHSRFGSAGSIKNAIAALTSLNKPSEEIPVHRPSSSSMPDAQPMGDSPVVTRLEYSDSFPIASQSKQQDIPTKLMEASQSSLSQSVASKAMTESSVFATSEKTISTSASPPNNEPPAKEFAKESPVQPPSRTSTTTSGGSKSIEADTTKASSGGTPVLTPTSGMKRMKNKKQTSAYTRGLLKQTPKEAMANCDYSGWMKKKSSRLMTSWKPRLFVLRGRRLSYYYTENDTEEQGLIDISNHKVLAADDLITGIHATVTGAKSSPTSPANAHTETMNAAEAAAQPDSTLQHPSSDRMFIFKLMPPKAGLSRAVQFTKPTVHYFAVDNIKQGRLWMAALMKATIERDDTKPLHTTYQQKTISLAKAKQMRQRPPALRDVDEDKPGANGVKLPEVATDTVNLDEGDDDAGLNIKGLNLSYEYILSTEARKDTDSIGQLASEATNAEPDAPPASAPLLKRQSERYASIGTPFSESPTRDGAGSLRLVKSMSAGLRDQGRVSDGGTAEQDSGVGSIINRSRPSTSGSGGKRQSSNSQTRSPVRTASITEKTTE